MLFDKLIDHILQASTKAVNTSTLGLSILSGTQDISYNDPSVYNIAYERLIWVYRCINIIANNIASLPILVYRYDKDGNKEDVSQAPEFSVLYKPNAWQTQFDFWMEGLSRLLLQGEMFWELERQGAKVKAIYADWRSEEVTIVSDPRKYITKYLRRISTGTQYAYAPEDVFFLKFFNPQSATRGISPLKAGTDIMTLELNAVAHNKAFFKRGMRLSGVLESPVRVQESERRRMVEEFNKMYTGSADKMHQVAFLWEGMKFTPLNVMSMADAEFTQMREMNREDICALFGVPLEVAGVGKKTYENWNEARRSFWQETLMPLILKIYSLLNMQFLPLLTSDVSIAIEPNLENVEALKENLDSKADRYIKGFDKGAVTPNELRTYVYGLDKIDDPAMNVPYIGMSFVPITAAEEVGKEEKRWAEAIKKKL